jgi:hypothetical protein
MAQDIEFQWTRFMGMWNTQKAEIADEIAAPGLIYHVPPFPDLDLDGLKDLVAQAATMPGFQVDSHRAIVNGDWSAHRWTARGDWTSSSALIPGEPTGKTAVAEGAHICQWQEGRLVEAWHIGDWLGWYQTAGAQLP